MHFTNIIIMKKYFLFLITILLLTSCEDIIDLELEQNDSQLVVDAWLNDQPGPQVIKLRRTIDRFRSD